MKARLREGDFSVVDEYGIDKHYIDRLSNKIVVHYPSLRSYLKIKHPQYDREYLKYLIPELQ